MRVARGPRPCDSPMECMDLGLSHLTSLAGQSPAFSHNYCPDNFSPVRSLRSTTICSPGRTAALSHQSGQSDSSCRSRLKFNKLNIFKTVAVNIYTSRHVISSSQTADGTRAGTRSHHNLKSVDASTKRSSLSSVAGSSRRRDLRTDAKHPGKRGTTEGTEINTQRENKSTQRSDRDKDE